MPKQQKVGDAARITGTPTLDDKVRIVVTDPALPSGEKTIVHSVQAADTINDIAIKLARKITDDPDMIAIGVNAYPLTAPTSPSTVGAQISLRSASGNLTTFKGTKSSGATEEIDTSIVFNGVHNARIGGTITAGDVLTLTVKDAGLAGGQESVAHTVLATDTTKTIATAFAAAINANANLQAIGVTAQPHANFVSIQSLSLKATTYEKSLSPGATETIGLSACINGTQTAVFGGTITAGDQLTINVFDSGINTGSEALTHTVLATDTPNTIATAFRNAINSNTKLQNEGITATSSASVLNISSTSVKLTSYAVSTNPGATETVTLAQAMNVTQYAHNNVNELTSHSGGGSVRFQGTTNKAVKSASVNVTPMNLDTTKDFSGNAVLPVGANNVSVSAVDGGNNTKTNQYQIGVKGGPSAALTYDLNGNMTSDGTRSFAWDAENRLIKITYPGMNNFTTFVYDPLWRNVNIVETVSGSVTDTKQFLWSGEQRREERNSLGALAAQFYSYGEIVGGTSYLWSKDSLGSIREMCDASGNIQVQYCFDPFGRAIRLQGSLDSDFRFSSYYRHDRSGLSLAVYRAYNADLGRWINRDPLEEAGGQNLFGYVANNPVSYIDQLGLDPLATLQSALEAVCRNPNCGVEDVGKCIEDAKKIANTLAGTGKKPGFVPYYSDPKHAGTGSGSDPVNGYWCWDWAKGMSNAIDKTGQSSFTSRYRFFVNRSEGSSPAHFGITLAPAGGNQCGDCLVNLDDAFGHGFDPGNVHPGTWKLPPGWTEYGLQNPDPELMGKLQPMPWPRKK